MIVVDGYSPRAQIVKDQVNLLVMDKNVSMCAIAYGSSIQLATVKEQVDILGK